MWIDEADEWTEQPQELVGLHPEWVSLGLRNWWNLAQLSSEGAQGPIVADEVSRITTPRGVGLVRTAASATGITLAADSSTVLPTGPVTIIYVIDASSNSGSNRDYPEFSAGDPAVSATQCHAYLPFSDGNVYWRYGNGGGISVAAGTLGPDVWVFTAGDRGMEIWQNGVLLANGTWAGNPRSQTTDPLYLQRSPPAAPTITSSAIKHGFGVIAAELTPAQIRELSNNPWQLGAPAVRKMWVPAASSGTTVNPGVGSIALTGYVPTIARTAHQPIAPSVGSLALTGYAPTIAQTAQQSVVPGVGSLTLTGYAPTVQQSAAGSVVPGAGLLIFTGYAPTITQTANQSVVPGAGSLALTGHAPTIQQSAGGQVAPGVGLLVFMGYAPTIAQTGHRVIAPGVGTITITGFAPTLRQGPPVLDISAEAALIAAIAALPAVIALHADKVFLNAADEKTPMPYVVVTASHQPERLLDGTVDRDYVSFTIATWGASATQAEAVADAIEALLEDDDNDWTWISRTGGFDENTGADAAVITADSWV